MKVISFWFSVKGAISCPLKKKSVNAESPGGKSLETRPQASKALGSDLCFWTKFLPKTRERTPLLLIEDGVPLAPHACEFSCFPPWSTRLDSFKLSTTESPQVTTQLKVLFLPLSIKTPFICIFF